MVNLSLIGTLTKATENTTTYTYFYGQGCGHCIKVENYFETTDIDEKSKLQKYEIWFDQKGRSILEEKLKNLPLTLNEVGTPFLVIQNGEKYSYLMGDTPIIDYFKGLTSKTEKEQGSKTPQQPIENPTQQNNETSPNIQDTTSNVKD